MFTKIALLGLLTYSALAAQEINNQPRVIADAKLAGCINHIGQNMVQNGVAQVPFTIKLDVSSVTASDQLSKPIGDPVTAACINLVARNIVRTGAAGAPFALEIRLDQ